MNRRDLDQTALTLNLSIGRSHDWISTEFHTANGPFTLVPLPGRNASLVWVTRGDEAARLLELPADRLALEVERRSHSILGKISVDGARGAFRLVHETATDFAAHRLMLVGESGHVLPPIGAQGLNLGLRDAAMAAQLALDARCDGVDVGSDAVTALYRNARRIDIATRGLAVDVLNRSLLTGFLPVQAARGLALDLMERIAPLRRVVMREGVRPAFSTPRLMEGQPL